MKFMIINDKLESGGAEIYAHNLKSILERNGNDVEFIFFDYGKAKREKFIDKTEFIYFSIENVYCKINKFFVNREIYKRLREQITNFSPDYIIVNNIQMCPMTVLKAIKDEKSIQVVHDYYMLCCKRDCIYFKNKHICSGYKNEKCLKNCGKNIGLFKTILKKLQLYYLEMKLKKSINLFISPSEKLADYLKKYKYNCESINNPIDLRLFKGCEIQKDKRIYLYLGVINEIKGIYEFLDVFNEFAKKSNSILYIVGKPETEEDEIKIQKYKKDGFIENLGYMPNIEVVNILKSSYCIVVPSLWMENYPTTVLEGMASKTLIIASERGGIPEMLDNNRGITFDILNKDSIAEALRKSYEMTDDLYDEIVLKSYDYVISNNSFETYYKRFINLLKVLN